MEVKINGWDGAKPGFQPAAEVFISPDERFAVAELYRGELFVIGAVRRHRGETLEMTFLEAFQGFGDTVDSRRCSVEWGWMQYGFFKIVCRELDSGCCPSRRYYFDRRLYEQKRRELHGEEE